MRVAVAVSGRGSNLEALFTRLGNGDEARIVLVLSDRADAPALDRARERGVAAVALENWRSAGEWLAALEAQSVDLLVLAGFLKTLTLKVGPEVKDLDQVKPGDQLVVRYFESLVLFVRKGDEPRAATEGTAVQVVPDKRKKPAGVAVDTVEFRGTVEAIDYAKRRVTLKGPEGKTRTIKVDPSVQHLNEVKKGDQIVVRYTEAIVFSLRKP